MSTINWPANMPAPLRRWRAILTLDGAEDVVLSVQASSYEAAEQRADARRFSDYRTYNLDRVEPVE